ncbi:MAG: ADP-ribosylglycohydrolase family protein [Bacilli bacterium]|nr:ADP-ribosylglycohydrolase family protein [Bacilli bacterium]
MKARLIEQQTMEQCLPKILTEKEQGWSFASQMEQTDNELIRMKWESHVPGSNAEEHVIIGAIQDMENMGYDVSKAEALIPEGEEYLKNNDLGNLCKTTAQIMNILSNAPKNPHSRYWKYHIYESYEEYASKVVFKRYSFDAVKDDYLSRTYLGWLGQIAGGALGTACEGYKTENIRKVFGEIYSYVREPNTFNDDITYELAFLKAVEEKGKKLTSEDIALKWVSLIPTGWSAEEMALRNIKMGIMPPQSGYVANPYREWIGAQMRGAVIGMLAPGDTEKTAKYAFMDGVVSHHNNGVLGEVFNAELVCLSYVLKDIRKIIREAIKLIPKDAEYHYVVAKALNSCLTHDNWEEAFKECEKIFGVYNWIHAYPNAAIEVIALWYGNGDYNQTMHITAMCGYDVDCNAAQIGTAIAIMNNQPLDEKWTKPIGDKLETYMREIKHLSIKGLAEYTQKMYELLK